MKEYRIYTEDKPNLAAIVSRRFSSFTILRGIGYWQGNQERCAIIIVLAHESTTSWGDVVRKDVDATCEAIRRENEQEVVLYTVQTVEQVQVTKEGVVS